jgi:hypothetical protein
MIGECELCDWTFERDETEDLEEHSRNVMDALEEYAKHMWLQHPDRARTDSIALQYIRAIAAKQARTS